MVSNTSWQKSGSFLDQIKSVYTGQREGINFRITEDTISYCKIEVDGVNIGFRIHGIDNAKKWCEDFEYCYECRGGPTYADKLCFNCYHK